MRNGASKCEWRRAPKRAEDFGNLKKVRELKLDSGREGLTFTFLRRPWAGLARDWGGGRWNSQNRKIVPLSSYVEKPLNSKVMKSFVPELRSCKCFSCFEILCSIYIYIYIWTLYVHFTHSHIWLWYSTIPLVDLSVVKFRILAIQYKSVHGFVEIFLGLKRLIPTPQSTVKKCLKRVDEFLIGKPIRYYKMLYFSF